MYGDDDVHCTLEQQPGAECVIVISFKMRPVLCRLSGSIRLVTGRGKEEYPSVTSPRLPPPSTTQFLRCHTKVGSQLQPAKLYLSQLFGGF